MTDWGMIQSPNFAQAALGGYQAGRAMGQQRRSDAALQLYGQNPDAGIAALAPLNPELANVLQQNQDRRESRELMKQVYTPGGAAPTAPALGGPTMGQPPTMPAAVAPLPIAPAAAGAAPPANGAPANGTPANLVPPVAAAPPAAPTQDVRGTLPTINHAALMRLSLINPEAASHIAEFATRADADQKQRLVESQDALLSAAQSLSAVPYEQRKAKLQQLAPILAQHFVSPEQLAGFDPTDANIAAQSNIALGVKGVFEQKNKQADRDVQMFKAKDESEHRRTDERLGAGRLAVAQGALALAGKRAAKAAGGGGDNSDLDYLMGGH